MRPQALPWSIFTWTYVCPFHVPDILSFKLEMLSNDSFILRRVRFPDILKKTGNNEKHNSTQPQTENSGSTRSLSCFCRCSLELVMVLLLSSSILFRHKHVLICSMDCNLFTIPLKKAQPYPSGKLRPGRTPNQSGQSQILPAVVKRGKHFRVTHNDFVITSDWLKWWHEVIKPIKPTYKYFQQLLRAQTGIPVSTNGFAIPLTAWNCYATFSRNSSRLKNTWSRCSSWENVSK